MALIVAVLTVPRILWLADAPFNATVDEVSYPWGFFRALHASPWSIPSCVQDMAVTCVGETLQSWLSPFTDPFYGARVVSVIFGIGSLLATYALGVRLFGQRTGIVAVIILGCSFWHIVYSRMAYPFMQPMLLAPLTMLVLLRGHTEGHSFLQFIGGVLLGVSALAYTPARIVIPIFGVWWLHRLVAGTGPRWRDALLGALITGLGAAIFLSPFLRSQGLGGMFTRYQMATTGPARPLTVLATHGLFSAAARELLARQISQAAMVYYTGGGHVAVDDFAPGPMLDHVSLALGLLGLGVVAYKFRDSRHWLLLSWIILTFVFAQLLTDTAASAYRAAPLLPGLALCAGLAGNLIAEAVERRSRAWHMAVQAGASLALMAIVLPPNLKCLDKYLETHAGSAWVTMARTIGAGSVAPVYYVTAMIPSVEHPIFQVLGHDHTMRDLPNPMDSLGTDIETTRDAVFVIDPQMAPMADAIRRCYPGATTMPSPRFNSPYERGLRQIAAVAVPQSIVAAGRNCAVPPQGPGLQARYFSGTSWDGAVTMERLEDWPVRLRQDVSRYRSIEWSGMLDVRAAGTYEFQLLANTPAEATIGAQTVLKQGETTRGPLDAGLYPLNIRCQPVDDDRVCWLRWLPPGRNWEAIPTQFLLPPRPVASDGSPTQAMPAR